MRFRSGALHHGQQGAALLAFMLVIIVTAATMLVSRLNEHAQTWTRDSRTQIALDQAKQALLQYAMNYPELRSDSEKGPGFLPCPFVNDDTETPTELDDVGLPESNCSVGAGTTIGRLPHRILGLTDVRDSSGERLWYALSDNFKNVQTGNPVINSDTPGLLNVDGQSDVVAVVISPGAPFGGQSGRSSNAKDAGFAVVGNYLEGTNATGGAVNFVTTAGGEFNDRLVTITRTELMKVVETRVVNEVRGLLENYQAASGGTYPWLAPFADPKSSFNTIRGSHSGSSNSSSLTDSSQDFTEWGIQVGDLVRNVTDGSIATVAAAPSATTVTLNWLQLGTDNDFDRGDAYVISVEQLGDRLRGTATSGSGVTTLEDTNRDFVELGVTPGDVVDNITSASSAVVQTVNANQIIVRPGGATFSNGNSYALRSNYGQVTTASTTSLIDASKNFITAGIRRGDIVINVTDGSVSRVASVTNATTLAMEAILLGAENDFDNGDRYYFPRHNTDRNTREGLLSFHERGEHFRTAFDLDWNLPETTATTMTTSAGTQAGYVTGAKTVLTSGSFSIDIGAGACVWMNEDFIECYGETSVSPLTVGGVVTSGTNTATVTDSTQSFITKGVKRGDIIQNFNDESNLFTRTTNPGSSGTTLYDPGANFTNYNTDGPYELLVLNNATGVQGVVVEIVDNDTLIVEGYPGQPAISFASGQSYTLRQPQYMVVENVSSGTSLTADRLTNNTAPDFDTAEYYRVVSAANSTSGAASLTLSGFLCGLLGLGGSDCLQDTSKNFGALGVEPGDVVENTSDGSFGVISGVTGDTLATTLYGGSLNAFSIGNSYVVYHGYVSRRDFQFRVRFNGGSTTPKGKNVFWAGGLRKRDACIGYGTTCVAIGGAAAIPHNSTTPVISITDYEDDGDVAATAASTINTTGTPSGNIRVRNIDYWLAENNGEIPDWFVRHKWYQYTYSAYSSGYQPGGAGTCNAGTTCLQLSTPYAGTLNDRRSIVMSMGTELATQNRAVAGVTEAQYLEDENVLPRGTHTGSSNAPNLTDSTQDFILWGVQPGDTVRNITDGSVATVSAVTANTLSLGALTQGADNDFDSGDMYAVYDDELEKDLLTTTFNDQASTVCPTTFNQPCP